MKIKNEDYDILQEGYAAHEKLEKSLKTFILLEDKIFLVEFKESEHGIKNSVYHIRDATVSHRWGKHDNLGYFVFYAQTDDQIFTAKKALEEMIGNHLHSTRELIVQQRTQSPKAGKAK